MSSLPTVVEPHALEPSPVSPPGSRWEVAFDTGRVLLVRASLDGGSGTGWHSHGERDAYGVVVSGRARLVYGPDGDAVEAGVGDFLVVPAGRRYRLENPAAEDPVLLLALVGDGTPVVPADRPTAASDADAPRVAGTDRLVDAGSLANLTRLMPFPDASVQQVRGHADGRVESSWHHHGDNEVFGYVRSGEGYVEWGHGPDERTLARAGEFFHVPAGLVHRDVNPSPDDQSYLLWLAGSEPRVVHVEGPADGDEDEGAGPRGSGRKL